MIVFETPGLIDGRSLTVVGLSAKPESISPIGRYGTGLKYAIAVLVRLGADVRIFIGRDEHHFVKRKDEFRGKTYDKIVMRRLRRSWKNWRETELPFTTDYGLNWKVWQVFRELEANTRDEHGRTIKVTKPDIDAGLANVGVDGKTRIAIDFPEFDAAWEKRDEVFLPGVSFASGAGVQIKRGLNNEDLRTASIYWRGLKVYEMGKPGLMTYNLLEPHVNLTEDRTLASEWWARYYLARWLVGCDDERVIEKIVTAPEGCWEHGLEFDTSLPPSAAFHRVMLRHPKATAMAWGYYARYDQRVTEKTFSPFVAHKLPWKIEGMKVVDAGGRPIFDAPYGYQGKWDIVAAAMLDKVNPKATEEEPKWRDMEDAPKDPDHEILLLTKIGIVSAHYSPGSWSEETPDHPREYDGPMWVCYDDAFELEIEETPEGDLSEAYAWAEIPSRPSPPVEEKIEVDAEYRERLLAALLLPTDRTLVEIATGVALNAIGERYSMPRGGLGEPEPVVLCAEIEEHETERLIDEPPSTVEPPTGSVADDDEIPF